MHCNRERLRYANDRLRHLNIGARWHTLKPSPDSYLYHAKRFVSAQQLVRQVETDGHGFVP